MLTHNSILHKIYSIAIGFFLITSTVCAQTKKDSTFKPGGKLWGLAYGDYTFKANADQLNRGGMNQYTGINQDQSFFQFRRIYLGYDYEINKTFTANFLLASEENTVTTATTPPVTSGDLLSDSKLAPFI